MNLKNLSDEEIHNRSKLVAHEEREVITKMLHHLKENERRRLFSKLRYPSLFEYAVKELKYSESQAIRRISAMRLMRDIPEIEVKIESGELNLTNLNLAQNLFSKEDRAGRPLGARQKIEILKRLENQSTREAKKTVCEISPEMKRSDQGLDFSMIKDEKLREKLLRLKGQWAHKSPNMNLEELLNKLCDQALDEKSPSAPKVERARPSQAQVLRYVWRRDRHRCTNCRSTYALEVDHIIPRAAGGSSTAENLRLLCRSCNQRAAIEYFGLPKMERHLLEPGRK